MEKNLSIDDNFKFCATIIIPFASNKNALYVKKCLDVDDELQATKVIKVLNVSGNDLKIDFFSTELRVLRVCVSSFYDMIIVLVRTLLEFNDNNP